MNDTLAARIAATPAYAPLAVALAFGSGILLVQWPLLGAAAVGLVCFVPVAMVSVAAGIALWLPVLFVALGLATTGMQLVLAAAWTGCVIARPAALRTALPGQPFVVGALAVLLAWLALTLFWARDEALAWHELVLWLIAAGVFVLVSTAIASGNEVKLVLLAFVAGALLSVALGWVGLGRSEQLVGPAAFGSTGKRFTGAEGNPNDLAAQLVPAIAFAVALAVDQRRKLTRLALAGVVVALAVALVATESRGGIAAFAAVVLTAPLVFWRQRSRALIAIVLVIAAAGAGFAFYGQARSRVANINEGGAGRSTLWLVAWRMAKDYSPVGVGLNNFRAVAPDYVRRPGSLRYVTQIDKPHVVHNTYLELLAETGMVGLALFLAGVGACLAAARRAQRLFEQLGRRDLARISGAVLLASVGILVTQVFSSNAYDMRFWVVFALGPALLAIAGRTAVAQVTR
ncbi:MAG: O-antigen ligase family protein [Thermoleophilaceae bacterium]